MNRTIKRTVTITITETWTIVWTDADDPVPQAPVTAAEAPAATQVNPNNTLPDQPTKGPGTENHPSDEVPVSAPADRRRKQARRRRAKDKQKRSAEETDNDDTSYARASHANTAGRSPAG
ncbi:MAG: hypothetical protein R3E79_43020 [Caldilineaceae bacterium]